MSIPNTEFLEVHSLDLNAWDSIIFEQTTPPTRHHPLTSKRRRDPGFFVKRRETIKPHVSITFIFLFLF
jgi:hypothetical protein